MPLVYVELRKLAQAIYEAILPPDNPNRAMVMQYLGVILTKVGHFREGENYLRRAMSINEMTPKKNFSTIALNKIDLSENLAAQNRFAEAEKILVEARGECIKNLGEENSLANKATDQLVKIYEKQGKPKLAENYK